MKSQVRVMFRRGHPADTSVNVLNEGAAIEQPADGEPLWLPTRIARRFLKLIEEEPSITAMTLRFNTWAASFEGEEPPAEGEAL